LRLTYHATPKAHFEGLDRSQPYLSPDFDADGFIHCTDSVEALPAVLTSYYRDMPGEWVVLCLDADKITSPVRYDDAAETFPHVYGPLNRDAILEVRPIRRDANGSFLPLATK
jgi:uncharacterized protein (DUF952 family)